MKLAIVGHEEAKFTNELRAEAVKVIIDAIDEHKPKIVVSGGCPLGGIDIWAEKIATFCGIPTKIYRPRALHWNPTHGYGYKARNLDIAENCDVLINIVVAEYPPEYDGRRFDACYHCKTDDHIKSGGCWTMKQAKRLGKEVKLIILPQKERQVTLW